MKDNMSSQLPEALRKIWEKNKFERPTDIQQAVYTPILSKKNIIMLSPTGSGKTLGYVLPLISQLKETSELQLLIVTPSQELASQVANVIRTWIVDLPYSLQLIVGGGNQRRQIEKLKNHPQIVVGTLGRLNELITIKKIKCHQIKTVVFDEVDQLFSEEREKEMNDFLKKIPRDNQKIFVSATLTKAIQQRLEQRVGDILFFDLLGESKYREGLEHAYLQVPTRKRDQALRKLSQIPEMRALVFVRTTAEIDRLVQKLRYHNIQCGELHSQMSNQERQRQIKKFQEGQYTYLITTDVASRGLDIIDLPMVIQYDLAVDHTSYLHRSGRTGRMGKEGLVLTLVNDDRLVRQLKQQLPEGASLTQYYLVSGQLSTVPKLNRTEEDNQKIKKKRKKKNVTIPPILPTKKHKKNRNRNQKNKGYRRKKN